MEIVITRCAGLDVHKATVVATVRVPGCPGHDESAGKRRSGKTRKANRYLRSTLIQAGVAASHKKNSARQALYARVKGRRGHKKAVVATGHQILEIAYYVMRDSVTYYERGADCFQRRDRERTARRHVKQLEALGYIVTVQPAAFEQVF